MTGNRSDRLGLALVAGQFIALGALAVAMFWQRALWQGLGLWVGFWALSALIGVSALRHNRVGNFNVRPIPKPGGQLVCTGPYRYMRHPMYSALLGFAAGAAWAVPHVSVWASAGALWAVLSVKARHEEALMRVAHPGYAAYCDNTRRFVPGLW